MLLTIDIGNTNLTLGLYNGDTLDAKWRLATDHARMPDEYGLQMLGLLQNARRDTGELEGICLSSVVPPITSRIIQACDEYLGLRPLVVSPELKKGIKILYDKMAAVGADRIDEGVGVKQMYGGPGCVIDLGKGTNFNGIEREGN